LAVISVKLTTVRRPACGLMTEHQPRPDQALSFRLRLRTTAKSQGVQLMPMLSSQDVADAVLWTIATPPNVQVR